MEAVKNVNTEKSSKPNYWEEAINYIEENSMDDVKSLKPKERLDFGLKAKKILAQKDNPLQITLHKLQSEKLPHTNDENTNKEPNLP